MKSRLSIVILFLFALPSFGQEIKVNAKLDTTKILLGDQVNLWFMLEHPEGLRIDFPATGDSLAGKIEVLSASKPDTISKMNRIWKIRQRLVVTSFDTGFYVIPPFTFRFNNNHDSIQTRALPLEVLGMAVDTTKGITDIKLPYEIKVTFTEILPYIIVGLLLLTIIILYIRYLRKKKQGSEIVEKLAHTQIPAHLLALEQLDELVREKLWQQGKIKLYYSRLTDIIRQYIELRFKVPAMEQTTEDIIRDFTQAGHIKEGIRKELKTLLELADLVKFAKWYPVAEEHEASQQSAYDFILRTKPVVNLRKPVDEIDPVTNTEEEK
ncbi:MAG: hypothetical protein D4R64_00270 [Porphyromonadaceae bacterium]|nr:MAG: hypothetical protein D4R64_00270 [Porphyromonadaceae bacterium]